MVWILSSSIASRVSSLKLALLVRNMALAAKVILWLSTRVDTEAVSSSDEDDDRGEYKLGGLGVKYLGIRSAIRIAGQGLANGGVGLVHIKALTLGVFRQRSRRPNLQSRVRPVTRHTEDQSEESPRPAHCHPDLVGLG